MQKEKYLEEKENGKTIEKIKEYRPNGKDKDYIKKEMKETIAKMTKNIQTREILYKMIEEANK